MKMPLVSTLIDKVPDDIWRLILEEGYLHHYDDCHTMIPSPMNSPIAFSHVSRRLRDVALGLPRIWSCIHVSCKQPLGYDTIVAAHIKHSLQHPLTVTLYCHSARDWYRRTDSGAVLHKYDGPLPRASWQQLLPSMQLLVSQVPRWERASMYFYSQAMVQDLFHGLRGKTAHLLQSLRLYSYENEFNSEDDSSLPCFARIGLETPALRNIVLYGIMPSCDSLTFTNVTTLSLSCLSLRFQEEFEPLLHVVAGSLENLSLYDCSKHTMAPSSDSIIALPRLRRLALYGMINPASFWLQEFALRLQVPCLETFVIHAMPNHLGVEFGSGWPANAAESCFPSVRHLCCTGLLNRNAWTPGSVAQLLHHFPAVEHLYLCEDPYNQFGLHHGYDLTAERLLDTLCKASIVAWPKLKALTVSELQDEAPLVDFVQKRREQGLRIKRIQVVKHSRLSREGIGRLIELGVQVDFSVKGPMCWNLMLWDQDEDYPEPERPYWYEALTASDRV